VGDALIAHELVHVAQQRAGGVATPQTKGETPDDALEEDADRAAVGAVASLWGSTKEGLAGLATTGWPRLRSGLRLQSCKSGRGKKDLSKAGSELNALLRDPTNNAAAVKQKIADLGTDAGPALLVADNASIDKLQTIAGNPNGPDILRTI